MWSAIRLCVLRRLATRLAAASFAVALMGCCPLARFFMMVHMRVMVEHADGTPAKGVALWYVDRELKQSDHSAVHEKEPACRTDATGSCAATLADHYCESVCPWDAPPQAAADGRFEILTMHDGKEQSLGFLQGVRRRGALLEGTLLVRID
jgi:hypothetical protein